MNKKIWDFYAPIYEKMMKSDHKLYEYMYEQISQTVKEKEVLEVATGPGLLARHVAFAARKIIATDYSEGMIKEARKSRNPDNLIFQVADITNLPFADQSFDIVIAANIFHLLSDPQKAMQEIRRVLRKDGILIAPNFISHQDSVISRIWSAVLRTGGIRFENQWNQQEYLDFLNKSGWRIIFQKELHGRIPLLYIECIERKADERGGR